MKKCKKLNHNRKAISKNQNESVYQVSGFTTQRRFISSDFKTWSFDYESQLGHILRTKNSNKEILIYI